MDFSTNDGRALLFCSQPLSPLAVKCAEGQVVVSSPDKDVLLPIAIHVKDAKPVSGLLRNGYWSGRVKSGAVKVQNLATGDWARP